MPKSEELIMATAFEKEEVKEIIDAFYKAAGLSGWNGNVNESVAAVFGVMLCEAKKCSKAMNWIPTPPAGRATISWIVMQLGRKIIQHFKDKKIKLICVRTIIWKWESTLRIASDHNMAIGLVTCD